MIELLHGDCLEKLKDVSNNSIDLVILDLPYGQTIAEWDKHINIQRLWIELKRVGKPTTPYIFFTTTKFGHQLIKSNEKWFRYDLVWNKPNASSGFLLAKKMPLRSHEMIYVFYKQLPLYNISHHKKIGDPNREMKYNYQSNLYTTPNPANGFSYEPKLPSSVLTIPINRNRISRKHPTEKPVEIYEWLITYYSKENDIVLDVCFGSGNSARASKNLNRNYIGIEMNDNYYKDAVETII